MHHNWCHLNRHRTRLHAAQVRKTLSTFLEAKRLLHSKIFPPRDLTLSPTDLLCDILPHSFKINFIVIFPSIPNILKWYFPFICLTKNVIWSPNLSCLLDFFAYLNLLFYIILILCYKWKIMKNEKSFFKCIYYSDHTRKLEFENPRVTKEKADCSTLR